MTARFTATVLLLAAAFALARVLLPYEQHFERSVLIDRPAAVVFTLLDSPDQLRAWSPWLARDPDAIVSLTGPPRGVGAQLSWQGAPRRVGSGTLEITGTQPLRGIDMHLRVQQAGSARMVFRLAPENGATRVRWRVSADIASAQGWPGTLLGPILSSALEPWAGPEVERALARLKTFAESLPAVAFDPREIELVCVPPGAMIYLPAADGGTDPMGRAFVELIRSLGREGIDRAGPPMAVIRSEQGQVLERGAAIPVAPDAQPAGGPGALTAAPAGPAVRILHLGASATLPQSHAQLRSFLAAAGLKAGAVSFERYLADPADAEGRGATEVYVMLADPDSMSADRPRRSSDPSGPAVHVCPEALPGTASG